MSKAQITVILTVYSNVVNCLLLGYSLIISFRFRRPLSSRWELQADLDTPLESGFPRRESGPLRSAESASSQPTRV